MKDFFSKNPRLLAVNILHRIFFEGKILDDFIYSKDFKKLEKRDRDLCYFLMVGTLKRILLIDFLLKKYSRIPLKKMDPYVLTILRISIFQIFFADRIPVYATLNEAVKIVKSRFPYKKYLVSFVNGILRNITKIEDIYSEVEKVNLTEDEKFSILYNVPEIIFKRLRRKYTLEEIGNYFGRAFEQPMFCGIVNTLKISIEGFKEKLLNRGIDFETSEIYGVFLFKDIGGLDWAIEKGYIFFQDKSIFSFISGIEIEGIESILDLCCAPGGKSFSMNLKFSPECIYGVDRSFERLVQMKKRMYALGFKNIQVVCGNSLDLKFLKGKFDLIYVDPPCTSTGTYKKNPEVFLRVDEEKIKEMSEIQFEILVKASKFLKKGGILIYSTCSILLEENEDVVYRTLKADGNLRLLPFKNKKFYNSFPWDLESIGFFAAILTR